MKTSLYIFCYTAGPKGCKIIVFWRYRQFLTYLITAKVKNLENTRNNIFFGTSKKILRNCKMLVTIQLLHNMLIYRKKLIFDKKNQHT